MGGKTEESLRYQSRVLFAALGAGGSNQRRRGIHADGVYAMELEHAAEAAFATANITRFFGRPHEGAGEHDRIPQVAAAEIATFAHLRDPGTR